MRNLMTLTICLCLTPVALGVGTSHWVHTNETDFKSGTFKDVVATNLGDLKLSRAVKSLLGQDARVSAVYAMTQFPDGTILAATGPEGLLLQIKDEQISTVAELGDNVSLFSLISDTKGGILVGTGGEKGQIFRIDRAGNKPNRIFEAEGVQYVWSMLTTDDGTIYAATGPNGQLFEIRPDGSHAVLFDSDENNLLCLLSDGKDLLFAGTDPNGLVYRINRKSGEVFVLYDAPETEISALARDAKGNLYAATAQATEPGAEGIGITEPVGRPETAAPGGPIPSERPPEPEPPSLPDPAPGEPLPIPRDVQPKSMRIFTTEDGGDPPDIEPIDPKPDIDVSSRPARGPVGASSGEPVPQGNAIYRIDPDGFVTEIFRQPVLVYCILETDGTLLVGTGNQGEIYHINPSAEETSVLAKVDPKNILCMLPARDGRVLLGLANSGEVAAMTSGHASQGTYTSPVLDASQISRFGKIRLRGSLPDGTSLRLSTRSGNVAGTSDAGWSAWSPELSAAEFLQTPSPPARFLQYRLHFSSAGPEHSPVVEEVDVAYQVPNLAPRITSITVEPGDVSPLSGQANPDSQKYSITWDSSDPNDDAILHSLWFRAGTRSPWILLKDKVRTNTYEWETRGVADGTYQIKIEASDAAANPSDAGKTGSRVSDPVTVDNTAPVIGDVKSFTNGGSVRIEMKAVDRTGVISSAAYAVNSSTEWQAVLPSDNIADSPEEAYSFIVTNLAPGPHQITLRVLDKRGNPAFATINVAVK